MTIEERLEKLEVMVEALEPDKTIVFIKRQSAIYERDFHKKLGDLILLQQNLAKEVKEVGIKAEFSRIRANERANESNERANESWIRANAAFESLAKSQESLNKTFEMYLKSRNGKSSS